MKVHVESYGCTMNKGEGHGLSRDLASSGHNPCSSSEDADIIILNTCTVVETTELRMLRRMQELRSQGKEVVVTGCMAKVQGQAIEAVSPGSLIVPPSDYPHFRERFVHRYGDGDDHSNMIQTLTGATAIIPIAQGCLGSCTYCITRHARGTLKSHSVEDIVERFKQELDDGAKELLLSSQDCAAYGMDIGTDLASLLGSLLEFSGEHRIRLGMMNPENLIRITDRLLDVMEDVRVYRFFHIPVQSGSDKILRSMGRRYATEDFISLVDVIRSRYPSASIATDSIVGFPGEDDRDHGMSLELMRSVEPDIINVTRFSPRPGTLAADLPERPHGRVSKARSREMTALRFMIGDEKNSRFINGTMDVTVSENGSKGTMICRTDCYRPVVLPSGPKMGERLTVRITGSARTHLFGEPVD